MQTRIITRALPTKAKTVGPCIQKPKRAHHTGKAKKASENNEREIFNIESVICGDGYSNDSGVKLKNLVIYASDRIDGGVESYYQVDQDSIMFSTRGGRRGGNWRTRAVTDRAKSMEHTPVPRVNIPSSKRDNYHWVRNKLREAALRWLFFNRGFALSVGGPGEREGIEGVEQHFEREHGKTFQKQKDGNCITAAITNAIDIVCGREAAMSIQKYFFDENPQYLKIREATPTLHELATGAEMRKRKIPKGDLKKFNANRFAYLANLESGVYVVHVSQPRVVSHTLVIDASRKLIIDSEEDYPMHLNEELLRKCGGDNAKTLQVGEVRRVVKQSDRSKH